MVAASGSILADISQANGIPRGNDQVTTNAPVTDFLPGPISEPCFMMDRGRATEDVETCYPRRDLLADLDHRFNTFRLVVLAFEQDVTLDGTVMEAVSREPGFLPVAIDMVEELVPDIREWDGGADFRLCAFTDPEASGEEELQLVVQYSDGIPRDEMDRKWDEVAGRMDGIAPSRELRTRTGVSFQPFW
jgi:hypothetical protein